MAYSYQQGGRALGKLIGEGINLPFSKSIGKYSGEALGAGLDYFTGGNPQQNQRQLQQQGANMQQQQPSMQQQPGMNPQEGQGNWFMGYKPQIGQYPRYDPQQQSFLQQMLQQAQGNTNFGDIENQYKQNFETNTIPSLAERFAGTSAGPGGSSRFRGALGAAGAGLKRDLAALRTQYGLEQARLGTQPMFDTFYSPRVQGAGEIFGEKATDRFLKHLPQLIEWLQQFMKQSGQQGGQENQFKPLPDMPSVEQQTGTGIRAIQQSLGTRPYQS